MARARADYAPICFLSVCCISFQSSIFASEAGKIDHEGRGGASGVTLNSCNPQATSKRNLPASFSYGKRLRFDDPGAEAALS